MRLKPFSVTEKFIKRAIDVFGSIVGCALFFIACVLLFPFYFFAPKNEKGPMLYTQKRFGRNGKPFQIYKFRTMIVHDESYWIKNPEIYAAYRANGNKLEDDPRVTKIGKFIRSKSLDELPQFLNVLKGEMSLVGPRPILEFEIQEYGERANDLWHAKPGITGYWTTHGRSRVHFPERAELELMYNLKHGFLFDIKTLFVTVHQLVFRKDAY